MFIGVVLNGLLDQQWGSMLNLSNDRMMGRLNASECISL